MKLLKNFWREILLTVTVSAFVSLIYYWTAERPDSTVVQSFMLIGIAASGICSVLLARSLWRAKWKKAATAGLQRIFSGIQRFFERFAEKFGVRRTDKRVLSGKTSVFFDKIDGSDEKTSARPTKAPKWKQLAGERERMRYLYRQMISEKLKKGALIYAVDTPSEIKEKAEKTEQDKGKGGAEGELFDMYIDMRYDERKYPSDEDVKRLKRELDIK